MVWSTINHSLPAAWNVVQQVGAPNLGLAVDAFHIFVRGRDASDLDGIPMDAIYLVQLSDLDYTVEPNELIETARHHRLLPGRGHFPIRSTLKRFEQGGYAGPIGLEVFNDDLKAEDPMVTAADAMAALRETLAQSALSRPEGGGDDDVVSIYRCGNALPFLGLPRSGDRPRSDPHKAAYNARTWPTTPVVTIVFAVGALDMYALIAWLRSMLTETAGVTAGTAGLMLAIYNFIGFPRQYEMTHRRPATGSIR